MKNTDDLIEINLDKDRPESFESNEAKLEWEMASARKALKFKKRVESGEFIPPEIKKKLEEKERMSEEDKLMVAKERQLERRKQKLRWLKIEQKLVDIDIAVKTALHLERPAPDRFFGCLFLCDHNNCLDRCITALEELGELAVVPLMLKKQPDIVTTIRFAPPLKKICHFQNPFQEAEKVHWSAVVLQLAGRGGSAEDGEGGEGDPSKGRPDLQQVQVQFCISGQF